MLASGLAAPNSTYTEPISFVTTSSRQDAEIGDKNEAKKKWRLCLERGKLIKTRIKEMGVEVSKIGQDIITESAVGVPVLNVEATQTSLLRQSSSVNGVLIPLWDDTKAPGWFNSIANEAGPSKRYGKRPGLNLEQTAYQPEWRPFGGTAPSPPNSQDQKELVQLIKVEQGMGANCSVVVGLELCLKHNLKWSRRVSSETPSFRCYSIRIQQCHGLFSWFKRVWSRYLAGRTTSQRLLVCSGTRPRCSSTAVGER